MVELLKARQGDYVFERLTLYFRQRLPSDATRRDAEMWRREFRVEVKDLDADYEPSEDETAAVALALRWWSDRARFERDPRDGGLMDQPMNWKLGMNVVFAARESAEMDIRFDEAEEAEARKG